MGKKRFRKLKALGKGVVTAAVAHVALQLQTGDMTAILADPKAWGLTVAAGLVPAVINAYKNRHLEGSPFYRKPRSVPYGYLLALVAAAALVAGCVRTTYPDGRVVTEVDSEQVLTALDMAWAAWERLEARRAALEVEQAEANARRRAQIARELEALRPQLEAAWREVTRLAQGAG